MRSPAAAIAWEFRRRHRWGLIAVAGYVLGLLAIKPFFVEPGQRVDFENAQTFALIVVVPLASTVMYFLAVFSFGLAGDLAARQSIYPARMFTLPVSTAALAGWPMLYGAAAMAVLWLATRLLAVWPSELDIPKIWPALLAASLLAWTQALTWLPYPLRGLRVIVTVLCLTVIDAIIIVAFESRASEPVMLAILAPQLPLAYLVARFAVARARRGDVPDWGRFFARRSRVVTRRADRFPSPARAQAWFEWRQYGRSLPVLVGMLLPFELALLFVFPDTPIIVFEILLGVLLTPPFMAVFVAATVSKPSPQASDAYGLTPFVATRPLSSASLIAAKLKVTIWSTLAAWTLVLVAIPLALRLSGASPIVIEWMRKLVEVFGTPRAVAIVLVGLSVLLLSTWKQLVQSLYIGMSGREWVVKTSVFVALAFLAVILPIADWILSSRRLVAALWNALPWILAALVCLKISAAAWIAIRLRESGLLSDPTLVIGAACWDLAVFAFYALLGWIFPTLLVHTYLLALVAILVIPLARLSAAPLAVAWNRHR